MKRIFAAALAGAMLLTSAYAADFRPGQDIEIDSTDPVWGETQPDQELTTEYYAISGQSWDQGKEMVESVKINSDDERVVISLKPDYTSTKDRTLRGTIKVRDKDKGKILTMDINAQIGYEQGEIVIDSDGDIQPLTVDNETVYTVTADSSSMTYGTLEFSTDLADVSVRVYEDEVYFLGYNRDPHKATLQENADSDAEIDFLNFEGKPKFSGNATLTFYGVERGYHIYELKSDKLVDSGAKWDSEQDSYVLKTTTLGSYVISDKALKSAGTTVNDEEDNSASGSVGDGTSNPETGANDVVGVAAALAVVSLASATALAASKK